MNVNGYTPNLIPFDAMPADQHREISSRGGKASGEARRKKRDQINQAKLEMIASMELSSTMKSFLTRGIPQMPRRISWR